MVADKQVDGDVAATNLAVAAQDMQWVISWDITGDTSGVAHWHVCYTTDDFTAGEMPTPCPDMVMGPDATTLSIDMPPSAPVKYFFTAVPMDALGNMDAAASMNSIIDTRVADNSNMNDNSNTIGDTGDDASSSVPTWTWGLIGGVVIVAFIAGAFILSVETVKAAKARTGITDPELNHTHLSEVYNAGRAATAAFLASFLSSP